ncbi:alanine dehydrogenase [Erythrobacter westpacificensis]|uniref:Alanine dehydrogenase n=1 Tax=Erythrobacter westpacificensis TaxID=1055231 RepID=A0ABP9K1X8_9SPHN
MIIGTVREIKSQEDRVGLAPESVGELTARGHTVLVEAGAGTGIDAADEAYLAAGAEIRDSASAVFDEVELIVKVKEPQPQERAMLRDGQVLFTYLHLAPDPEQTRDLMQSGATCIAYETVTDDTGGLPLLKPMSQVAGRLSAQAGATALQKVHGGRGVLLGGVPGVMPAKVTILGGGVVGFHAAQMAVGLGAEVTIVDRSPAVLERLATHFENRAHTSFASQATVERLVAQSDLVIGAVLIPGASAPKMVTREMLGTMQKGAVLVDVAIDQGGCFETSRATSHADPTYIVDDIVHYCVANMPGGVARTSTFALNAVTLPHVINIAERGWEEALRADRHLRRGLNVWRGEITCEPVAKELGESWTSPEKVLSLGEGA